MDERAPAVYGTLRDHRSGRQLWPVAGAEATSSDLGRGEHCTGAATRCSLGRRLATHVSLAPDDPTKTGAVTRPDGRARARLSPTGDHHARRNQRDVGRSTRLSDDGHSYLVHADDLGHTAGAVYANAAVCGNG